MPGGYLRVLYPAPEACLDLKAWQEFYGFDMNSVAGELNIEIDTDHFTMSVQDAGQVPAGSRRSSAETNQIRSVDAVSTVDTLVYVPNDFFGEPNTQKTRLPGPFTTMRKGSTFSIDPRKPLHM